MQGQQRGRISDRSGAQHESADHGEDGRVGADAEADGKNRDSSNDSVPSKCAQSLASILQEILQPRNAAAFAMRLAGLFCTAEMNEGLASGFIGSEAGSEAIVGVHVYVGFEFGGEVSIGATCVQ